MTLDQLALSLEDAEPSTVCLASRHTEIKLPVEAAALTSARFEGDPYSSGTTLSLKPDLTSVQLQSAWSPTEPLYYLDAKVPYRVFSDDVSTLKELCNALGITLIPDERFAIWSLTGLPAAQFGLSPMRTPWSSIKQVPAGIDATVAVGTRDIRLSRRSGVFWDVAEVSTRQALRSVADTFVQSVAACSEGSIAVLASGGIDSSAVVGACCVLGRRPTLFTNTYPNAPETDERHYIDNLQRPFGLNAVSIESAPASLLAHAHRQGRPFRGLFRADDQKVIAQALSHGISTVLDGLGGDELFAVRDYPIGRLSHGAAAKQLLPPKTWSRIFGRCIPEHSALALLPPFVVGVDEQELLWEFKFRPLLEMGCPDRIVKRVYSLMFESNFWEEAQWLAREVFAPHNLKRRHPFIDTKLIHAVLSTPQRLFGRTPVVKAFQRQAFRRLLPTPIAHRYGGAEQTANVMFNLQCSRDGIEDTINRSFLAARNSFIDGDRLRSYYREGLNSPSAYEGGPIAFDNLWSALCYDQWALQWGHQHAT
ncbi:asparagine synthase C-terminal domain-containing protein [Mycolicibacterium fluoranthenivorans]|nr:asparagine synthase C-terminal domain-containing protein [Mycolicibacterium fluoranthenivorans]